MQLKYWRRGQLRLPKEFTSHEDYRSNVDVTQARLNLLGLAALTEIVDVELD